MGTPSLPTASQPMASHLTVHPPTATTFLRQPTVTTVLLTPATSIRQATEPATARPLPLWGTASATATAMVTATARLQAITKQS